MFFKGERAGETGRKTKVTSVMGPHLESHCPLVVKAAHCRLPLLLSRTFFFFFSASKKVLVSNPGTVDLGFQSRSGS